MERGYPYCLLLERLEDLAGRNLALPEGFVLATVVDADSPSLKYQTPEVFPTSYVLVPKGFGTEVHLWVDNSGNFVSREGGCPWNKSDGPFYKVPGWYYFLEEAIVAHFKNFEFERRKSEKTDK